MHTAPAYGVDDLALGQKHGLPVIHAVGRDGAFLPEIEPVAGMFFKDADKPLIRILKERGLMFRSERYQHSYPFRLAHRRPDHLLREECLVHPHVGVPDRMVELNKTIKWVPETHSRRPLRQLARKQCRLGAVAGALLGNAAAGLDRRRRTIITASVPSRSWSQLSGQTLSDLDLHRPAVDDVTFEKDGKTWTRVPEVIDCWFDSGAMSYAQWHYPFENQDSFRESLSGRLHLRGD